jgi:hypothetical protein
MSVHPIVFSAQWASLHCKAKTSLWESGEEKTTFVCPGCGRDVVVTLDRVSQECRSMCQGFCGGLLY